jgi:hypothetical protein
VVEGRILSSSDAKPVKSRAEIEAAISAFTPGDWARLRLVAQRYAGRFQMGPEDLIQEAIRRALEDTGKKCPCDVGVLSFLGAAMRSIADDEKNLIENKSAHLRIAPSDETALGNGLVDPPSAEPNVEELAIGNDKATAIYHAMRGLFDNDPVGRALVDGIAEELTAEELRERTGLDKVAYASKRRLIRRTIDQQYPDGWPL